VSFFIARTPRQVVITPTPTVELAGYYKDSKGVISAGAKEAILSGQFTESVATKEYLLTTDKEGTLTLIHIPDKKTIKIDDPQHAYKLKVVGDDFGYLKQHGEAQYITFLDPVTGKSSPVKTEHNVITWDAIGTDISYHLYDTTTIGFAQYDNKLGMTNVKELDAHIETIGQMFSKNGKNYVWVVANKTENIIYSAETRKEVTPEFPVVKKLEEVQGTLSEIVANYWILTAPTEGTETLSSQIWDDKGDSILDLTIIGYKFSGNATQGNKSVYLPVSYTGGTTPDGLFILNMNDHSTDFEDGLNSYISE
jgi:hypothetical protein